MFNNELIKYLFFNFLQPIDPSEDTFWSQFWSESITNIQDVFALIPSTEIRVLREGKTYLSMLSKIVALTLFFYLLNFRVSFKFSNIMLQSS